MNLVDFEALLHQPDLAFVDAVETEAFQSMLKASPGFPDRLDEAMRWKLLYGLWVVLLDFGDDPAIPWMPSMVSIPGLPSSLSLQDVLQALVIAVFDISSIDWSDEFGCTPVIDQHVYETALRSQACQHLVEDQIEAGLKRVLACDFSPPPAPVVDRKPGLLRKVLAVLVSLFDDRMPQL